MIFRLLLVACVMIGVVSWLLNFYGSKVIDWFVDKKCLFDNNLRLEIRQIPMPDEVYFAWRRRCEVLEQENRELREYIRVNLEKKGTDE